MTHDPDAERPGLQPGPNQSEADANPHASEDLSWSQSEIADAVSFVVAHMWEIAGAVLDRCEPGPDREQMLADLVRLKRDDMPGRIEPTTYDYLRPAPGWPNYFGLLRCRLCGYDFVDSIVDGRCPTCDERGSDR